MLPYLGYFRRVDRLANRLLNISPLSRAINRPHRECVK